MPSSGHYQEAEASVDDTLPIVPSLDTPGLTSSAPTFCLDDDSDDSLHQFMQSNGTPLPMSRRDPCCNRLANPDFDDEDDEVFSATSGSAAADCGSPYGPIRTRPPSPRRPIAARPLRAAASGPPTLCVTSSMTSLASSASPSPSRNLCKRRPAADAEDPGTPVAIADNRDSTKRRRLATEQSRRPFGDATNRTPIPSASATAATLSRCASEMHCGPGAGSKAACVAMDSARIDKAIASIDSLNLIGNSAQGHALPTVKELDFGIRYVTPATVSRLLAGQFTDRVADFTIVDCRYPYEFNGGHIRGAVNLYRPEELLSRLLAPQPGQAGIQGRVIIFHCEFSSERAPRMARLLRQHDRKMNSLNYPQLHYPELYLLQGGYKAFYELHKADCSPVSYTRMADPDFKDELAHFHRLGRAWERQNSRTKHSRLERMAGSPLRM